MKAAAATSCLILTSLFALDASAQAWFAGGAVGQARQQDFEVGGPVATRDDTDTSFRLFGGYRVSDMQSVVASWVDLGETYYDGAAFGGFTDSHEAEGIDISYVVDYTPGEQQRVSVFGSVGIFAWDQDVRFTDATSTILYHDEGTSFSLGLGGVINLSADGTNPLGILVGYQLFKDVGDADNSGHEIDRDVFSVGVSYRFGESRR